MKKILLILVVAIGVIYITSPQESQKIAVAVSQEVQKVLGIQTKKTATRAKKVVKQKAQETTQSMMFELTNQAQETVNTVASATNTALEQKTQQVLGAVFQTTVSPSQVTINPLSNGNNIDLPITTIDFLNDGNKSFKFERNKKYHVRFKNLPDNYCLFINNSKYELPSDKIIEMMFSLEGTYAVRFDYCTTSGKFADIVVE